MSINFALIGAAGYVASRHLGAIKATGNKVIAAIDPNDSVGILDSYSLETRFFTEIEMFARFIDKLRVDSEEERVHYVSICSPNYLHNAHIQLSLQSGADAICEKPLVIRPDHMNYLRELEHATGKRVYTISQLRNHPKLLKLKHDIVNSGSNSKYDVNLTYITARGNWYHASWKGSLEKSGGLAMNIGLHFFDLLIWLFGEVIESRVYHADPKRLSGYLELQQAKIKWFLSVDSADLPFPVEPGISSTHRSMTINGQETDFTGGFGDLHSKAYEEILSGRGLGIDSVQASIELAYQVQRADLSKKDNLVHPFLLR